MIANLPQVCELCGGPTPAARWYSRLDPHAQLVSEAERCFMCFMLEGVIKKQPEVACKILKDMEQI